MNPGYKETMHIQSRFILTIATLVFALASGLPNEVSADELKEAKVTQVIQDVRILPSNASPRPAVVNDNVHQGTAVQTGVQSRSELTFKDQTITRLGEKTIFSVGEGARTIDLGSGQVLLYVPKKSGGAKVKMGPVTAAITGTTILASDRGGDGPHFDLRAAGFLRHIKQNLAAAQINGSRPFAHTKDRLLAKARDRLILKSQLTPGLGAGLHCRTLVNIIVYYSRTR